MTDVAFSLQICVTFRVPWLFSRAFGAGSMFAFPTRSRLFRMADRPRVVIALPDPGESALVAEWLAAEELEPVRRSNVAGAADEMRARAFDLLIVDATFALRDGLHAGVRGRNPLTPTVMIGDSPAVGADAVRRRAMYLNRPVDRAMLVCTVSMAILDGRPTRRSPRKLVNRFSAVVNGMPSHIIDVSNEGVRLEIPGGRRWVPPPYFNIRVPTMGVGVIVQRMWVRSWPTQGRSDVLRCGGALARNRTAAEQGWRTFVDTIPVAGAGSSSGLVQVR